MASGGIKPDRADLGHPGCQLERGGADPVWFGGRALRLQALRDRDCSQSERGAYNGSLNTNWIYLWQGGRLDTITGDYQFGARDYNPVLMRWMTNDPIGLGGGDPNTYRMERDDVTSVVDPTGLQIGGSLGGPSSYNPPVTPLSPMESGTHEMSNLVGYLMEISPKSNITEMKQIANAIANTWTMNYKTTMPRRANDQRAKGYFCYEWAYAFEDAFNSQSSTKSFKATVEGAEVKDTELVHAWLRITSCATGKSIYVDDGFMIRNQKGKPVYVHKSAPIGSYTLNPFAQDDNPRTSPKVNVPPAMDPSGNPIKPKESTSVRPINNRPGGY